ncbi:MAG: hypothetical protein ACM3WQ_02830 [Chloroflexota bacterium]|nr:hypothetical protein [Candidatus Sulfotelmatobacter sp.]
MNTVYEHIVAILVVGAIFVGTVVALPATINANLQTVDQQQLRNTASNVFDSMLLGVGSPSNWGSKVSFDQDGNPHFDAAWVERFGLACADPFSKYVLDSDKVQRLNPTELNYESVRKLLNIQNDYGFQFSIYRPFRVASSLNINGNTVYFSVTVTRTEDGTPIPNAAVKVTTYVTAAYINKTKTSTPIDVPEYITSPMAPVYGYTGVTGNYQNTTNVSFSEYALDSAVAIMEITVAGMSTTVVKQNDYSYVRYINVTTYGDNVILSIRGSNLSTGESPNSRQILDAVAYDSENSALFDLLDDPTKVNWGVGKQNATMLFPGLRSINPTVLLMVLQIQVNAETLPDGTKVPGGKRLVLCAGPFSFADSGKIYEFGGDLTSRTPIALMRRLVVISDMTYVATLAFWRE